MLPRLKLLSVPRGNVHRRCTAAVNVLRECPGSVQAPLAVRSLRGLCWLSPDSPTTWAQDDKMQSFSSADLE